jgi:hypothetical protein
MRAILIAPALIGAIALKSSAVTSTSVGKKHVEAKIPFEKKFDNIFTKTVQDSIEDRNVVARQIGTIYDANKLLDSLKICYEATLASSESNDKSSVQNLTTFTNIENQLNNLSKIDGHCYSWLFLDSLLVFSMYGNPKDGKTLTEWRKAGKTISNTVKKISDSYRADLQSASVQCNRDINTNGLDKEAQEYLTTIQQQFCNWLKPSSKTNQSHATPWILKLVASDNLPPPSAAES